MRFTFVLLMTLLTGCASSGEPTSRGIVTLFYQQYMRLFTSDQNQSLIDYSNPVYNKYVSADVIQRLKKIDGYYEQEIVSSDYFMYMQDYAPEWISEFHTGRTTPFLGGETVEVFLADADHHFTQLLVYTRKENNQWKIYRVRDLTNHFEHAIYSSGDIAAAQAWSTQQVREGRYP
ncbi:DUF3828 domain-containing protein [Trabulsiella odontotermitis]|uniref:DUF3828 domain-containing protein n=1 Tax=Trabulsiella odontotermitis TaxID=379893 RepID=UPI0024B76943|nr:DUF3828 domain-containing protein [Trabulsiella odontotermitis]WHP32715.1 DUF3828 domain-containing protein [Trabulsiella odontotermitis]